MQTTQIISQSPPPVLPDARPITPDKTGQVLGVAPSAPSGRSAFAAMLRKMASSTPGKEVEEVAGNSGMPVAEQEVAAVASPPEKKDPKTEESPTSAADELPLPVMLAANGMPMAVASILPTQLQPQSMAAQTEPLVTTVVAEGIKPAATVAQQQGGVVKNVAEMVSPEGLLPAGQPTMSGKDAAPANIVQQQSNPAPASEQLVSTAQTIMVAPKPSQGGGSHEVPDTIHPSVTPGVTPAIMPHVENAAATSGEPVVIGSTPLPLSSSRPAFQETVQSLATAPGTTPPQEVNANATGQAAVSQSTLTATPSQPTAASALQGYGNNAGAMQPPVISESAITTQPETDPQQSTAQSPSDPVAIAKSAKGKTLNQVRYETNQHLHGTAVSPEAKSVDSTATTLDPATVEVTFKEPSPGKESFDGDNSSRSGMNEKMSGTLHNGAVTDVSKNFTVLEPQPKTEGTKTALSESILAQVKDSMAAHEAKGHNQITISLKPAELGKLKINVSMVDQRLKVEIVAENRMVKDALMSNLDSLKDTLSKQNLTMDKFDVQTGVGHGFSQSSGDEKWVPRNQSPKNFINVAGTIDEGAEERVGYLTTRNNSLVDVRF